MNTSIRAFYRIRTNRIIYGYGYVNELLHKLAYMVMEVEKSPDVQSREPRKSVVYSVSPKA